MRRLGIFSLVGAAGAVVQLGSLALLVHGLGAPYLPATALAVVLTVQHNFLWHERWTWRDRAEAARPSRWRRCLAFHLGNGLVSLLGNLVVTALAVERLGLAPLPANVVAIAACAAANFLVADRIVWRRAVPARLPLPSLQGRGVPSWVAPASWWKDARS